MTFIIKKNFDNLGFVVDDFVFDLEGYDYILEKSNIFMEGTLATQDYDKLNFILQNYNKLDPNLLESLHYKNKKNEIPLHLAVYSKNSRLVNLILAYMAKVDYAAIAHL